MHYIIYRTTDGKVLSCMKMSERIRDINVASQPDLAYIEGYIQNTKHYYVVDGELVYQEPTIDVHAYIRDQRRYKMMACDWTQAQDTPLTEAKRLEWATYRQALRDLPETNTATHVDDIVWPSQPD